MRVKRIDSPVSEAGGRDGWDAMWGLWDVEP